MQFPVLILSIIISYLFSDNCVGMLRAGNYEDIFMSIKKGYTKINNTLFWAVMQLPRAEQLVFACLRIESDYLTHVTDPFER